MWKRVALSILLVTWSARPVHALTVGGASVDAADPRAFGAAPNDGVDDRQHLQEWIAAGCASPTRLLYLPPGDWHVTRGPGSGPANIASLRITCDGLTLLGAGRASRILMQATAVLSGNFRSPANWSVFEIAANDVTIEGIAIDGSGRSDTGEQTHLIQVTGPARDTELRHLYFNLPTLANPEGSVECRPGNNDPELETRMCTVPGHGSGLCKTLGDRPRCSLSGGVYTVLGWFRGGDCIRSVGDEGKLVDGISIADSYAVECDRSFISLQRASHNFTITGNVTRTIGGQIIDLEPSGDAGLGRLLIMGNRLERGPSTLAAISLSGNGPNEGMADSIIVSNNILDGGIITANVGRVSIEHNVIKARPAANGTAVIQISNRTESLRLIGNEIERLPDAPAGSVVTITERGPGRPVDVTMALNTIRQNTAGHVVELAGAQNVTIADNTFHCGQPADDGFAAIKGLAIKGDSPRPIEQLIVSQNRARGRCRSLVDLDCCPARLGAVTITGNQTLGFPFGVRFSRSTPPGVTPRVSDNLFEGTAPVNFVEGPPGFVFNGDNGPLP